MWTGVFPLELANPMLNATIWEWAGTLHHVYLVPLLLMIFLCRRQRWGWNALYLSVFLFAGLTLFSYACLPAISNVNYAFRNEFNPSGLLASWMNVLSDSWYLVALNSIVSGAIFFPTAVLLNRLAMKTRAARRSKSFLQMS